MELAITERHASTVADPKRTAAAAYYRRWHNLSYQMEHMTASTMSLSVCCVCAQLSDGLLASLVPNAAYDATPTNPMSALDAPRPFRLPARHDSCIVLAGACLLGRHHGGSRFKTRCVHGWLTIE